MSRVPVSISEAVYRYRETYRVVRVAVLLSFIGLSVELFFALWSSSIILYTDVLHWAMDGALELVVMITAYVISKIYRRIKWNIFALESLLILMLVVAVFAFYITVLVDYVSSYVGSSLGPTTTNPYLALVTGFGGSLTLITFYVERRAYKRLRTEILRADSTHALIDVVVAVIASIGIVITAYTRDSTVEFVVVLFVLFAAIQTLGNLAKDALKSILGFEADPQLKVLLISRLSELNRSGVKIGEVELRKMGTFYVAKIKIYLDPRITIGEAHRLRKTVNIICREVSDLIYHVDVMFYPMKRLMRTGKRKGLGGKVPRKPQHQPSNQPSNVNVEPSHENPGVFKYGKPSLHVPKTSPSSSTSSFNIFM